MHGADIERGKIGNRRAGLQLAIERVARLQRDLLALADFDHRRDVRVEAVVAATGLFAEPLSSIDADRMRQTPPDPFDPDRCD
jgi:hypothetical protein